jgi:hypothetical protein
MIEILTDEGKKMMIVIHKIISFEAIDEHKCLIIADGNVEYKVLVDYEYLQDVIFNYYSIEKKSEDIFNSEEVLNDQEISETYTLQEQAKL